MKHVRVLVKNGRRLLGTFTVPEGWVVCRNCLVPRPDSQVCLKCDSTDVARPERVEQEARP